MAFFSTNSNDYIKAIQNLVKPEYDSKYNDTISNLMDTIANRKEFSYDFNADPLYQNYKDQYTKLGNEAAMNAASAVATQTGGYGNSYAASAAAQANQQYLTQLNDVIPELYNAAMNKYQMETNDLYNQFGMYQSEENRLYGQHRDDVSDYYSDWNNLNSGYGNALANEQWRESFDYQKLRDQVADSQWQQEFALKQAAANKAKSGGSGGGSKKSGSTPTSSDYSGNRDAYVTALNKAVALAQSNHSDLDIASAVNSIKGLSDADKEMILNRVLNGKTTDYVGINNNKKNMASKTNNYNVTK